MQNIKIYEIPTIDYVEKIDDPRVGMIFYIADIDMYYSVKALKEINSYNTKGDKVVEYIISDYAEFGSGSGGGSGLTAQQLANIAKIPVIQSTVDGLPNNYAAKAHRHDASEIDNLPSGGNGGSTTIVDNLNSTSTTSALSANQGRVIKSSLEHIETNILDGKSFKYLTQVEYDSLSDVDKNNETIVYCITDATNNDSGTGMTSTQVQQLNTAYNHSQSTHFNGTLTADNGSVYALKVSNTGVLSCELVSGNVLVTNVSLDKNLHTMKVDEIIQLNATVEPTYATDTSITWSASNSNCTVINGLVTAKAIGECVITAKANDGSNVSGTCTITIQAKEESGGDTEIPNFVNYCYNTDTFNNPASGTVPKYSLYYQTTGYTKDVAEGIMTLTRSNETAGNCLFSHRYAYEENTSNIWYYQAKIKIGLSEARLTLNYQEINYTKDNWITISVLFSNEDANTQMLSVGHIDNSSVGEKIEFKEPMLINLTEVYGSGKELDKETCDATFTSFKNGLVG